jgi:hypothetical protein
MAHRHRIKSTSTYSYQAPIQGAKYNPRAHGGVVHVDRCACGATRACNSTGGHTEQGPWRTPDASEVRS